MGQLTPLIYMNIDSDPVRDKIPSRGNNCTVRNPLAQRQLRDSVPHGISTNCQNARASPQALLIYMNMDFNPVRDIIPLCGNDCRVQTPLV